MCRVAMISVHGSPLASFGSREAGGMQVYVRDLSRAMGERGMVVDVFTRLTDESQPEVIEFGPNVRVIHLPAGEAGPVDKNRVFDALPTFVCNMRRFVEREQLSYRYVHSHYWLSGWVGKLAAQRWDVPHVATFHTLARVKNRALGGQSETEQRAEIEARVMASAGAVVVSSDHERQAMVDLYGASRERIHVIPPGIDLELFRPVDRSLARRELGLDGQLVLLSVGRMDPVKGFDVLLRALASLDRRLRPRLLLVGGSEGDPEYERLRTLAGELNVTDQVSFLGAVPQRQLPLYYSAASAVVVPSHYESFGLAAAEALACGTPVIASRVGGLPTIVRDGENGLLVRWRRPEAFANQIERLLTDPALLARLRANAHRSVDRLSWGLTAERTIRLYRELGEARQPELVCSCPG